MLEYAKLVLAVDSAQARTAKKDLDTLSEAGGKAEKSAKGMTGAWSALKGAFVALGIGTMVTGIVQTADSYQLLQGRLALTTRNAEELTKVQRELFDLSQRTATSIKDQTELYIGLAGAASELGATQAQLLKFTEGVGNALRLSGTSTQGASSAILQLTQLIGGSVVQAQEFNALLDNGRTILVAVANNLDKAGGSVGRLRALVKEGKVSSAEFFEAFLKGSDDLSEAAGSINRTVGQAFTQLKNVLFNTVGQTGTSPIVEAIDDLREAVTDPEFQRSLISAATGVARVAGALVEAAAMVGQFTNSTSEKLGQMLEEDRIRDSISAVKALQYQIDKLENTKGLRSLFGASYEADQRRLAHLQAELAKAIALRDVLVGKQDVLGALGFNPVPRADYVTADQRPGYVRPGEGMQETVDKLLATDGDSDKSKKLSEAQRMLRNLREQVDLYGELTELQKVQIALDGQHMGKVTEAQKEELKSLASQLDFKKAMKEADEEAVEREEKRLELIKATRNPLEQFKAGMVELNQQFKDGYVDTDVYGRRVRQLQDDFDVATRVEEKVGKVRGLFSEAFIDMEEMARRTAGNMHSALSDLFFDPFERGLDGMVQSMGTALRRMAADMAAQETMKGIMSLGMSALSGMNFGLPGMDIPIAAGPGLPVPGMASGGLFGPGWKMVGEQGPELVHFNGSGRVYNNGETAAMQGSGGRAISVTVQQNFYGSTPDSIRQTAMQAGAEAGRAVRVAVQRNG